MTREFRIIAPTGEVRVTGDAALVSDYDIDPGDIVEYRQDACDAWRLGTCACTLADLCANDGLAKWDVEP